MQQSKEQACPKVSIIVACRNEQSHIVQFLRTLLSQDLTGFIWEAIIADGMSDDGTREILKKYSAEYPQIHLIDNPGRIVSTGLNKAISASSGEIILRMDAHTEYAPDYCLRCVNTLRHTGADNVGGPARTRAEGNLAKAIAAAYHSRFSTGGAKFHDTSYHGWVDTVPYGCWHRATFDRVGMFDENLVRNQDDEFNLRLVRAGGKIWQDPAIESWYSPRASLGGLFLQYFQYGFWKVAVIRKHRVPGSWRHLVPCAFVFANAALFAGLGAGAVLHKTGLFTYCALLWLALLFMYLAVTLIASVATARRNGWPLLAHVPAVFATFHVSYASGFLAGLVASAWSNRASASQAALFTRISR